MKTTFLSKWLTKHPPPGKRVQIFINAEDLHIKSGKQRLVLFGHRCIVCDRDP